MSRREGTSPASAGAVPGQPGSLSAGLPPLPAGLLHHIKIIEGGR